MRLVEAKGILSARNGMNVYRGCLHGCIYCDSRSTCYGFEHPFEDIEVKVNAPELLERALRAKRKRCMIGTGSMCDPYLPIEQKLRVTRRCLESIDRYGFGVSLLTKSTLVLRDIELLDSINQKAKAVVQMTITTADEALCRIVEPNVATTAERFEALERFRARGIPTMVWLSPILPFINDTEENIRYILKHCIEVGVKGIVCFGMGVTLRDGDRQYFYRALDRHFPGLKKRYIDTYGNAYEVASTNDAYLMGIIAETCKRQGIMYDAKACFAYMTELPDSYCGSSLLDGL